MTGSREQIEADINRYLSQAGTDELVTKWLDRQVAITCAECDECSADWEEDRDEQKAKAEEYRLRVADYECELVRNEGECRCFTIPPKTCVRDNRMCQDVLKAVDGDDR